MLGAIRAAVGGSATPIINSTQTLTAASTIAITSGVAGQICQITAASAITLTSNPQIAAGSNGQIVRVVNTGANVITFANTNGISLNGTLALGNTQWAEFVNLGGFWQLGATNGSPVWTAVSFLNSFANYGTGYQNCEYTKYLGTVRARGLAFRNVAYSAVVPMFNLPAGHRPFGGILRFPMEALSTPTAAIDIGTTGDVSFIAAGTPASQFVPLNVISFIP